MMSPFSYFWSVGVGEPEPELAAVRRLVMARALPVPLECAPRRSVWVDSENALQWAECYHRNLHRFHSRSRPIGEVCTACWCSGEIIITSFYLSTPIEPKIRRFLEIGLSS